MTPATVELDVVIPVKYGLRFLPEAVSSALAQEGAQVSVWIVDDGADADIRELLGAELAESCVIVANEGTPGIGGARNTGAALGSAPLLAFLDCDDLWPADRTTHLLAALADQPEAGVAFGMVEQFVDGDPSTFRVPQEPARGMLAGGMLLRRSLWESIGEFDADLRLGEFIDWVARLRAAGQPEATTDAIVLRRRIHGDNTTVHRRDDRAEYLTVIREHLRRTRGQ